MGVNTEATAKRFLTDDCDRRGASHFSWCPCVCGDVAVITSKLLTRMRNGCHSKA